MSIPRYVPDPEPLIETSPGVYEQARYRYTHVGDPKPGDTVWISERQDDGSWGPDRPVTVAADTNDDAHEQQP